MISKLLGAYCRIHGISYRQLSKEIGFSPATFTRVVQGKELSQDNMVKLLNWLFGGSR